MIFFAVEGCKKDDPVSTADTTKKPLPDSNTIYFVINELGLHNLRAGEHYQLWLKIAPDTSWKSIMTLVISYTSQADSAVMVGSIQSNKSIDSIMGALISIENSNSSLSPSFPLLEAKQFISDHKKLRIASLNHDSTIGDYSDLQGSLVFTSRHSDSLAYTHEFYLMNLEGGGQTPTLKPLKIPIQGWKYGLWAEDTNFTPHQYFFYGLFTDAKGHDSDSINDFYPFPGGWKSQRMNVAGGSIIITLEPQMYGDQLKFKGPSPFTLLNFDRMRFIEKDKNYPMINLSNHGLPSGTILFRKN